VKFSDDTSTCTADGTVKVEYVFKLCGATATTKTQTVKVAKKGHQYEEVQENYVEATCTAEGGFDDVVKCKYCGDVKSSKHITISKLAHKYDAIALQATPATTDATAKVIDVAGSLLNKTGELSYQRGVVSIGSYDVKIGDAKAGGQVVFSARTQCTVCGTVNEKTDDLTGRVKVEVVKVTKEDEKGQGGSIQLKATYTYTDENEETKTIDTGIVTYPYYSTETSYSGRTETNEVVKNGLVKDEDGVYRYYVGGKLSDETGIIYYEGGRFLIENGVLASERNGLYLNVADQKWYYLSGGQVRTDVEVAPYNGSYFYLTNGVVDTTKNGLVPFAGGQFLFAGGQIQINVDGLWCDPTDGTWYYLAGGQRQTQHTGVVFYDGAAFYVEAGKLAVDYNGTVQYNGATFKVVGGQLY
jgi:hypothetical protein